jgi:hypothetical protein
MAGVRQKSPQKPKKSPCGAENSLFRPFLDAISIFSGVKVGSGGAGGRRPCGCGSFRMG